MALWTGCGGSPSYPPPEQRTPVSGPVATTFGSFVSMGAPDSSLYVVQGFASASEGPWRWAYDHPVLQFWGPDLARPKFIMDVAIPEKTFRYTGPVTLTVKVNGEFLDSIVCAKAGPQPRYSREVPSGIVRKDHANLVSIDPDKVWTSKDDGTKYGFILLRAGFVE